MNALPHNDTRFVLELEFIQCLANPAYIQYLAQNGYFNDESFLSYLEYLKYWKNPPYLYHVQYPHCFVNLEMILHSKEFRQRAARSEFILQWHEQQYLLWKNGRKYQQEQIFASFR